MSKKVKYYVMSDRDCKGTCGKKIKQNLVNRKPDVKFCYKCGRDDKKNSTAREVRTGKKPGREQTNLITDRRR